MRKIAYASVGLAQCWTGYGWLFLFSLSSWAAPSSLLLLAWGSNSSYLMVTQCPFPSFFFFQNQLIPLSVWRRSYGRYIWRLLSKLPLRDNFGDLHWLTLSSHCLKLELSWIMIHSERMASAEHCVTITTDSRHALSLLPSFTYKWSPRWTVLVEVSKNLKYSTVHVLDF